ncbi:HTH_48 domain-containing protein [Trichonephila clavipes]|nr:HTH_48 domain-containing protein [Trichonephila clavipes]
MEVTRVEQRAYIKIAVVRERNATECRSELGEALRNNALQYRTVARWVGKFQQGHVSTCDGQCGAENADADGIQRLPYRCGDSSRGIYHRWSLGPGLSCQLCVYCVVILLHREGHIAQYTTVIN